MESKKINQLATELTPALDDLTIIGDPTTGISKKITLSQMASLFTGTVEEYANLAAFPLVGVADTIYIALDTNVLYRWNTGTNAYVELSPNIINSLVFSDANGFDGNISLVGSVATLTITTALTTGSVPFIGASGALSQDNANLFFDDTNNRLGVNTNVPTTALDVFGSGIIGRLNGTSTNNSFLGFASAGSNKWSIGNVQSDHRFRIYNEATTSELVSVLQTGEFGIGIANPTTKLHIDGGASALIANLDANVSVAKSISFRSDNSNRINLEVSGTESGSNAGANFFIRRYSDAGALIDTPLTITRSTGAISLATALSGTSADFSSTINAGGDITIPNGSYYNAKRNTGGATINVIGFASGSDALIIKGGTSGAALAMQFQDTSGAVMSLYNTNVGIGTATPTFKLDVNGNANIANGLTANGTMTLSNDGTYGSTYKTLGFTGTTNGTHRILAGTADDMYIAAATARGIYFWTDGSSATKMRILANGNVGIGINNPSDKLIVNGIIGITDGVFQAGESYSLYLGDKNAFMTTTFGDKVKFGAYNGFSFGFAENADLTFSSTWMTINLNGGPTLDIRNNNNTSGNNALTSRLGSNCNNTSSYLFVGETGSANKIFIYGNGNVVNANNSYGSLSDLKLKENISDTTNKLSDLLKVKVRNYNFIGNEQKQIGVIAQELEEIFPSMIDETEDIDSEGNKLGTVTKSVKYSVFVPMLIKAIQELNAKIDAK